MTTFEDGPAKGHTLALRRAPILLRVVENKAGKIDALDLLEDRPAAGEAVTVYILASKVTCGFVDGRDKSGKRWGRRFAGGIYRVYKDQPPQTVAFDNVQWKEWVEARGDEIEAAHTDLCAARRKR